MNIQIATMKQVKVLYDIQIVIIRMEIVVNFHISGPAN